MKLNKEKMKEKADGDMNSNVKERKILYNYLH